MVHSPGTTYFLGTHWVADPDNPQYILAVNPDGSINVNTSGGTISVLETVLAVAGSASSAAVLSNFPITNTRGYRSVAVQVTAIAANSTLVCEQSNDGTAWTGVQTQQDRTSQSATPMQAIGLYIFPVDALQYRVRQSVYGGSGASSVTAQFREYPVGEPQITTQQVASDTGTETNVAASASDVSILTANTARRGYSVYNDSTAIMYLLNASGAASSTNYSLQVAAGGYFEAPFNYRGQVRAAWASATGNARVTEFT